MKHLNELTITEARELLDSGDVSSVALTEACLGQIQSLDGALHAFLEVWLDEALEEAKRSDERRARGLRQGEFDGIPIAVKDNMLVQGRRCSAGSKILENYVGVNDATVIAKLKAQGAVFLGRTNMDEFAMGSSTENSAYGPTKHPRDPERVPGGSSGGSAVAVAANMCLAALGSDTGGSIRQPASLCGVVGFKPTYGRVSRSGLIAMASSLDQIGPLTKCVDDTARLFEAIQGKDPLDQTTADVEPFRSQDIRLSGRQDLKGVRVGLPRQAWGEGMTDDVRTRVTAAVGVLKSLGAEIVDVDLPYADEALAVYYVLMPCEVSANLARFDGMRYGLRDSGGTLLETYLRSRASGFGREVRRRVLLGTYALSHGYYDAYYRQAKRVQTLIQNAYAAAFEHVDTLVSPTSPSTAFRIGEKADDPLAMYLEDIFTVGVNVSGLPAVSVPVGDAAGFPVGMHLTGRAFDEATLLRVARAYEVAVGIKQVNK
ncbi:MAG TPA: Asp-tRNA(Asn)/Glu-tRNA(Gln) amidotransferase subunit GatA [Candidatus Methylomirabilis sp.]|nr:Asp-tRNA(Asn)/Glu-tRNA(Gln) amidotransferase subunit GatA [Candidatus Methylomirabilis sp.]